jgi:AhpD family alkylhydroperoxidase
MTKQYREITDELSTSIRKVRSGIPDVMEGFSSLAKASIDNGALDKKTKELIALGISVANRCDGCVGFHTKALVGLGVSKEEILETLGVAIYLGGGPSLMFAAEAMDAFEQFTEGSEE